MAVRCRKATVRRADLYRKALALTGKIRVDVDLDKSRERRRR